MQRHSYGDNMTIRSLDVPERTIYDRSKSARAYLSANAVIYLFNGQPIGYVYRLRVWTFHGMHVGWMSDGWLRSQYGYCVGCTNFAHGPPYPGTAAGRRDPPKGPRQHLPAIMVRKRSLNAPAVKNRWSQTPLIVFLAWVQFQAGE